MPDGNRRPQHSHSGRGLSQWQVYCDLSSVPACRFSALRYICTALDTHIADAGQSRAAKKHDGPVSHQDAAGRYNSSVLASTRQNLARIEDVVGIEGSLDLAHDGKAAAVFGLEVFALALPDAVLARARAFHANGPLG